ERSGIGERGVHHQVAAERVAQDGTSPNPEHADDLDQEPPEARRIEAALHVELTPAAAGKIDREDAKRSPQRLEHITKGITRGHEPMYAKKRRPDSVLAHVDADRPDRALRNFDVALARLEIGVRNTR